MVDTMMIAPLGETFVGAVGLCPVFVADVLRLLGLRGRRHAVFLARYWGAKDEDGIDRSFGLTLVCMLASASIFTCLALLAPEFVMRIYTDKPSIQAIGVEYLRIVGFAYPMQVISMAMSALLRSHRAGAHPALCGDRVRRYEHVPQLGVHLRAFRPSGHGRSGRRAGHHVRSRRQHGGHPDPQPRSGVSVSVSFQETFPLERPLCALLISSSASRSSAMRF